MYLCDKKCMCLGALIILNIEHILVFFKFYVGPRETINKLTKTQPVEYTCNTTC